MAWLIVMVAALSVTILLRMCCPLNVSSSYLSGDWFFIYASHSVMKYMTIAERVLVRDTP